MSRVGEGADVQINILKLSTCGLWQHGPLKCPCPTMKLYGITTQKNST